MKLSCIRKKRETEFFRLRLSKDVRKTMVPSFMFLFNSFEVCHPLCNAKKRKTQFSPLNQ